MDPLKNLNTFLEDLTYASEYEFLEEGKDDAELATIANKRGITLPSHDLAIFKCKYAFTDRVNKNGCLLPREEVAKSLSTLIGKAVDFDHFRKRICGTWIDAELIGDQIVAYGSFFKSNLQDDFTTIKDLMQRGALSVSFEAWGNKKPLKGNSYSLNDICFAGGALLLKESPAFPGADVMEMANNRVLEFAKVMTKPESFFHTGEEEKNTKEEAPEVARRWIFENSDIMRLLEEVDCEVCHTKACQDLQSMDYIMSIGFTKCLACGTYHKISFTPRAEALSSGKRVIKEIATSVNIELREDIVNFIDNYEGSDENLEIVLINEFEGDLEESKFTKCNKCASAFELHGNISKCPKCGSKWEKKTVSKKDDEDEEECAMNMSYQDRQALPDEMFATVVTAKNKKTGKPRKIRMFPMHDSAHIHNALSKLTQASESLQKMGFSQETIRIKILNKARELKMDELMKLYNASTVEELIQAMAKEAGAKDGLGTEAVTAVKAQMEQALTQDAKAQTDLAPTFKAFVQPHVTSLINYVKPAGTANETSLQSDNSNKSGASDTSLNKAAVEKLEADLKEVTTKLEAAMTELKVFKDAEEAKVKAELASKIQARKDELGEFAKEMKDEDIMDETKFELAKLRKENAELKAGKAQPETKPDLKKGSADKNLNDTELKTRGKVDELAFGRDGQAIEEKIKSKK